MTVGTPIEYWLREPLSARQPMLNVEDQFGVCVWIHMVSSGSRSSWDRRLTPRWSGRVRDKMPSSNRGVRAAQLNR